MKITRINMKGYIDHIDYADLTKGVFTAKKTRVSDIYGSYKADECNEVEIDSKDVKDLAKKYSHVISVSDIVDYLQKKKLLPAGRVFIPNNEWKYDFINDKGVYNIYYDDTIPSSKKRQSTGVLHIFHYKDFVKLPATKKEQDMLDHLANRARMKSLNNLVLKDNFLKILNDNKYNVELYKDGETVYFKNKAGWNRLVHDAITYYLNNTILKEIKCEIVMPLYTSSHACKWSDSFCNIGDLKMIVGDKK